MDCNIQLPFYNLFCNRLFFCFKSNQVTSGFQIAQIDGISIHRSFFYNAALYIQHRIIVNRKRSFLQGDQPDLETTKIHHLCQEIEFPIPKSVHTKI